MHIFRRGGSPATTAVAVFLPDSLSPEQWERWGTVMAEASGLAARSGRGWRTLSALLASSPGGIPAPLRGKLWQELCGASEPVMAHLSAEYVRLIKQRSGDEATRSRTSQISPT